MKTGAMKRIAPVLAVAAGLALLSFDASAQTTIASQASTWKTQIQSIIGLLKLIFGLFGFGLFGFGLMAIYKDNKQPGQGHAKTGAIALLVGTGLMIVPFLIGMFAESAGSGQGQSANTLTSGSV